MTTRGETPVRLASSTPSSSALFVRPSGVLTEVPALKRGTAQATPGTPRTR